MKFLTISALLLVIFVSYSTAQWQRCHGRAWMPSCAPPGNMGHGGQGCMPRVMWYYNRRMNQCQAMRYMGCGGTSNRWCSRASCEQRCRW